MGLLFLIGPAGSGKTHYIVDSIVRKLLRPQADDGAILLLVPEQATFQMEKRVLEDNRLKGFMDLQVLSFRRLAWKILDETGVPETPFMTPVGKSMAFQSILWKTRKNLSAFRPLVDYPGFRDELSSALEELAAYGYQPGDLESPSLLGAEVPFLGQKARDLAMVYREYQMFLKDRFLDPTDTQKLAAQKAGKCGLLKGATVFVDGFSGFTPDEYALLGAVLEHAQYVSVALCMDKDESLAPVSDTSLFHQSRDTYERLKKLAWQKSIKLRPNLYFGENDKLLRFKNQELLNLEAGFRKQNTPQPVFPKDAGVKIISAANPLAEVEFAAREILHLVRDCGYRFKDITVELREMGQYSEIIPLVFKDHGIPFFLDRKKPLSHHPLSELLRAAMDVSITCFSSQAVFRYLKTDLVPVDRETVDILENYVLAHGINGERWISDTPWHYRRKYLQKEDIEAESHDEAVFCDGARRQAMLQLKQFYEDLRTQSPPTADSVSRALYDLLIRLEVPETLAEWQELAEENGDLEQALEHAGLWDKAMEILEQASEILKDQNCDLKTYALLLDAGLEDARLGVIPPSLDQVLVGTLDRSRQPECAAAFLMGAIAGVFPKRHQEGGIFTDKERSYLEKLGFELEPGSRARQLHEKYLAYIALTRASSKLYISYPLGDSQGNAEEVSHVVGTVRRILGHKPETFVSQDPQENCMDYLVPGRILGFTVRQLANKKIETLTPMWLSALKWLTEPTRKADSYKAFDALSFSNLVQALPKVVVRSLYGETLQTSVSRLERFAACPFSHFATDGLRLRERDIYKLEPADAGTFLHEVIRDFVQEASFGDWDWAKLSREQVLTMADSAAQKLLPKVQDEIFMSSARYSYVGHVLNKITRRAAQTLTEHTKRGSFMPKVLEAKFGFPGHFPPLRVPLSEREEVVLRGQIDRVDALELGDSIYLRVIDYKSSPRPLDLLEVYHGLSLQLLVYLLVAVKSWAQITGTTQRDHNVLPAGALYFVLKDPILSRKGPVSADELEEETLTALKMSGLCTDDLAVLRGMDSQALRQSPIIPVTFTQSGVSKTSKTVAQRDFGQLLDFVQGKVRQMSREILSGRVDVSPYRRGAKRACTFCPYGPLCMFDVLLKGNDYRLIRTVPQESLWEDIRNYDGTENDTEAKSPKGGA